MTRAQAVALERDFATYRLPDAPFDGERAFGRTAPLVLEIGFGMGQGLLAYASAHPEANCIGAEVYRPGIGSLVAALRRTGTSNVRIYEGDARLLVETLLPPDSLSLVLIYFPDPWPKKRHHKRRLIEPEFVAVLASRLQPGGRLRLATDWEDYALRMIEVLENEPTLVNEAGAGCFAARSDDRPVTRFEARGLTLGHAVWDLAYVRGTRPPPNRDAAARTA
jgi:tRNA (guanine-N7-)-methyltransferase